MPLYDYVDAAGHRTTVVRGFNVAMIDCEACGAKMHRDVAANSFSVAGRGKKRHLRDRYFAAELEQAPYRSQRDVARAKERARQVDALTN